MAVAATDDDEEYQREATAMVSDPTLSIDLEQALAKLRPPERLCVTLAYAEGMSHREIASVTGLPLGTAKTHVSRGATKSRRWLGDGTVKSSRSSG